MREVGLYYRELNKVWQANISMGDKASNLCWLGMCQIKQARYSGRCTSIPPVLGIRPRTGRLEHGGRREHSWIVTGSPREV